MNSLILPGYAHFWLWNFMDATTLFNSSFLVIDGESLSLTQVLQYFQLSGKLFPFIREIVEQHLLFQEIQRRSDLDVSLADVEQVMVDFRLQHDLTDRDRWQAWLTQQGMDHLTWQNQILLRLKLEKLVVAIAAPQLAETFAEQQAQLETVTIALITSQNLAALEELAHQLQNQETSFTAVSLAYADSRDIQASGKTVRLGQLPAALRSAVAVAPTQEWVGPIVIEDQSYLFQIQERTPAELDGSLKQELQLALFQQWLTKRIQEMSVRLANQPVVDSLQPVLS